MAWVLAALGLVILLVAGDLLVRGAVNLSLRLGVPALLVSLTIVSFGTSAPELLISVKAVLENAPGLALGNVVGSNTANILLVLGLPALVAGGLPTAESDTRKSYLIMLAASVGFVALAATGPITWVDGLLLLGVLFIILIDQGREALAHRRDASDDDEDLEGADPEIKGWQIAAFLILGLIGLPLGGNMLVNASLDIAASFGVSDTVVGLTLVALGTSLPELATTLMAAIRKQADVALGNVIGSNMFNLLAIIGVASFFGDIPVDPAFFRFDFWAMLAASLIILPFVFFRMNLNKRWGILLSALYICYIYVVVATA